MDLVKFATVTRKMGEKANAAKGIDEPMKMQEVAYHTWPECYPVGDRRDIV